MSPKDFVKKYYPYAKASQDKTGIDARFTLAQAALESGWGERAVGNMFFGIKAGLSTPPSQRQLITTTEILNNPNARFPAVISKTKRADGRYKYVVKDWFKKYTTPEESFTDHADFFFKNKRYANALKVKNDPNRFAEEIAKAGYATDPNYAGTLQSLIKKIERYV